jgi:hypothetical protein
MPEGTETSKRGIGLLLFLAGLLVLALVVATIAIVLTDDDCSELARRFAPQTCLPDGPPLSPDRD